MRSARWRRAGCAPVLSKPDALRAVKRLESFWSGFRITTAPRAAAEGSLPMDYLAVHIETNHRGLDPLTAFLSGRDIESLLIEDRYEEQTLGNPAAPPPTGDEPARVTFYLGADETGFAQLGAARIALSDFRREHPGCGTLLMTLDETKDDDWMDAWKAFWQPTPIGERLLVVPAWEDAEAEGRVKLFLDPGRTFGSGTHVTTKLCLAAIEGLIQGGERVADLGCGSGILAIAALKLGAERAFACDREPDCPAVVAENLARNGVSPDRCIVRCGDLLTDGALVKEMGGDYDLVLANIVSDVILALAPRVRGLLAPGGRFLCSGIIDTRAEEVAQALTAAGLTIGETLREEGWCAFLCR